MGKKIKIARRHVDLPTPYYKHAISEVESQTARGAAIAGTAFLDILLRMSLERLMRPYTELQNTIFENRGPLQDFSARIHVSFALKLIGTGAYNDLNILRDVRNAFAHSAEAFEFDREDIARLCNNLWYPKWIRFTGKPDPVTPRQMFVRSVQMIAQGLTEFMNAPAGHLPPQNAFILYGPPWPTEKPNAKPERPRPSNRPRPKDDEK